MILTETKYNDMWTGDFGMPIHTIPSYYQYLQREVYQQDYMDLFEGKPTFNRETSGHEHGVPLEIFKNKRILINPCSPYVKKINGKECLLVDYEYPFDAEIDKWKGRCIQYVLIGEAAPPQTKVPLKNNTYFYNTDHFGNTDYFNAPCKAFGVTGGSKQNKLIQLANKGVILYDLFPFAIAYNDIRTTIINLSLIRFYVIVDGIGCENLCKNLKFSFLCCSGKDGHAEYIIENVNEGNGIVELCHQKIVINNLSTNHWGVWLPISGMVIPHPLLLPLIGNWHPIDKDAVIAVASGRLSATDFTKMNPQGMISKYKSIGKIRPNGSPHHIAIRFSFNL